MADYYTNFSLNLKLPDPTAVTEALQLHDRMQEESDDEARPDDIPEALWEWHAEWAFDCELDGTETEPCLWLHSSNGGIDAACAFIQHLLQKHQLKEPVTFEWSHDCSKPRTDAYGGGAACITDEEIRTFNTAEWVREQLEARKAKPHRFSLETQLCVQCGVHSDDAALAGTACHD